MILISNQKEFQIKKDKFISEGSENLHILSDFDRTLTKAFLNGEAMPAIISVLRNENYLSEEYSEKAKALANYYHPIELDPNISFSEKKEKMSEWWNKHFDLLIKSGLNKKNLDRVINEGKVEFREEAEEFLDLLNEEQIPLVIISSSGIGDLIPMYLKKHGKMHNNIHIIANLYKWDKQGKAIGIQSSIIHVFNKDETILRKFSFYDKIKERKNILLLGDSLGDVGMLSGAEYDCVIKIGFLNEKIKENLEQYKKAFDVIITDDGDFSFVNKLLAEIINKK
jgi:5'-nucleotidase